MVGIFPIFVCIGIKYNLPYARRRVYLAGHKIQLFKCFIDKINTENMCNIYALRAVAGLSVSAEMCGGL